MFSNRLSCHLSFPSCISIPKDQGSDELLPKMAREPIILNVYDMVSNICKQKYLASVQFNKLIILI